MSPQAARVASRFLRSNKTLVVYRIDPRMERDLTNRNAGNLEGIVSFLSDECEDYALDFCMAGGHLTSYEVEVHGPPGPYQKFRGGHTSDSGEGWGMVKQSGWDAVWYSFPASTEGVEAPGGWRVKRILKSIPVSAITRASPQFMSLGWVEQRAVLDRLV